jgi:hypothetical protein
MIPFFLLSNAIKHSLKGDSSTAYKFLSSAREWAYRELDTEASIECFSFLALAASTEIARNYPRTTKVCSHNEYGDVQHWFKNNHKQVVQGSKIVRVTGGKTGRYRPDFLIDLNGELLPVECKKTFNSRSLNQLECYLSEFGASIGYAVAFELKCKLPDHIEFIKCPFP